jgi:hypothetical protein
MDFPILSIQARKEAKKCKVFCGVRRAAFWKSGVGGFALIIVPSLDLVIYKMGGNNGQYDPTLTDVAQPEPSHERDDWKPIQGTPFIEGRRGGDDGIRRLLGDGACGGGAQGN